MAGGTALAQVLGVIFYPIITRLYNPEEFGVYTLFAAFLGMIYIVGALKYENSIPIADDDEKAINALSLSFLILLLITLLVTIILWGVGDTILNMLDYERLLPFKYFIPLGVILTGLYTILMQWGFRKKGFKKISMTKITRALGLNLSQVGFGLLNFGAIGLISGKIIGEGSGNTTLGLSLFSKDKYLFKSISFTKMVWVAKRYRKFPILSAPAQFFNKAGIELPVFFITAMYGEAAVGLYGLAHMIVSLPMTLIGTSVSDVFYAEAASVGRTSPEKLKTLSFSLLKKLVLIGVIPLAILLLFGPLLFGFVFGEEWTESGVFAQIIAFLVFARFIFTPISRVYYVFERQGASLMMNVMRVVLVVLCFVGAEYFDFTVYYAIATYALGMIIVYLTTYLYAQRIIRQEILRREV